MINLTLSDEMVSYLLGVVNQDLNLKTDEIADLSTSRDRAISLIKALKETQNGSGSTPPGGGSG